MDGSWDKKLLYKNIYVYIVYFLLPCILDYLVFLANLDSTTKFF